jgi:hypothetical protein
MDLEPFIPISGDKFMSKPNRTTEVAVRIDRLPKDFRRIVIMQFRELIHEFDDAIFANNIDISPAQFDASWTKSYNEFRKAS